jgi:hypothetical protein
MSTDELFSEGREIIKELNEEMNKYHEPGGMTVGKLIAIFEELDNRNEEIPHKILDLLVRVGEEYDIEGKFCSPGSGDVCDACSQLMAFGLLKNGRITTKGVKLYEKEKAIMTLGELTEE